MFVCKRIPRGTRAGQRGGLAMQTSLGWRMIALYSAKSSHERYSNSILFRFLQKIKKKKNSFFNKPELNFASELNYRFQDLFKEEMPMFKALVLKMKPCLEKTHQNGCPLRRPPFITSGFHLVLELSSCLACMYLT